MIASFAAVESLVDNGSFTRYDSVMASVLGSMTLHEAAGCKEVKQCQSSSLR